MSAVSAEFMNGLDEGAIHFRHVPVTTDIHVRRRASENAGKALHGLDHIYRRSRINDIVGEDITILRSGLEARAVRHQLAQRCSVEFAVTHLGEGLDSAAVDEILPTELDLLARRVGVRVLLQQSALPRLAVQSYVNRLTNIGAQVRTAPQIWFQLSLFDQRAALISAEPSDDPSAGAVLTTDPSMVARVRQVFDDLWETSASRIEEGAQRQSLSSELRRSIFQMLANGSKDEAAARRLGMSLRTYRRHVASLMSELGARTRFQAGLLAHEAGLTQADGRTAVR